MNAKVEYQVTFDNGKTWETCVKASESGRKTWLHYELKDGTNGLRRPNSDKELTWRIKP